MHVFYSSVVAKILDVERMITGNIKDRKYENREILRTGRMRKEPGQERMRTGKD